MTPAKFRALVWRFYKKEGRHDLPWRQTHDVYKILVSEVMLQQTQVERVVPLYKKFIKQFPTAKKLVAAPLSEVLVSWQGLGYNRRAKMLHSAAKILAETGRQKLDVEALETLPGVGPYTARAVAAFAYNQDGIVIETNIRTVIIHHFLDKKAPAPRVSDVQIAEVLERVLPKGRAREWYSALMDYGAHLKRSGISHNVRAKSYAKQAKFAGSLRQARGAILRELARGSRSEPRLLGLLGDDRREQMREALTALLDEGFIVRSRFEYALAR